MTDSNEADFLALADAIERFQHRAESSILGGVSPFATEEDGPLRSADRQTLEKFARGFELSLRALAIGYLGKAMFLRPTSLILDELRNIRLLSEDEYATLASLLSHLNLELLKSAPSDAIIHLIHQRGEDLLRAMRDLEEAPAAQLTGAIWTAAEAAGLTPRRYDNRRLIIDGGIYVRAELLTGDVQANGIANVFTDDMYRPEDFFLPNELVLFTADPGFFDLTRLLDEHNVAYGWRDDSSTLQFSNAALERYPWAAGAKLL
jgi:hypothetical protein